MQQSKKHPENDPFVIAYEAENPAEAAVLRALLESFGIPSPNSFADPFPLPVGTVLTRDTDVLAPASRAQEARALIASKADKGEVPSAD